jgi:hypothetical protein
MNANKNYIYLETEEKIDNKTGETSETKKFSKISIPKEENYIKIYIKHINYLNNLPNGLDPLIYALIKRVGYNNQIIINSSVKRQIADDIDKSFNTINQYITKLVKYKIILRKDTGIYVLNPVFYGKGSWTDIVELRESLEINITYKEGNYTISTNLD